MTDLEKMEIALRRQAELYKLYGSGGPAQWLENLADQIAADEVERIEMKRGHDA